MKYRSSLTPLRAWPIIPLLGVLAVSAGCYSRTIESKGIGARFGEQQVYEPNMKLKDPNAPKKERKGGFFSNMGEFFFGSDEDDK